MTNSETQGLLPCPFCGKPPSEKTYAEGCMIHCFGCGIGFNSCGDLETVNERDHNVDKKWNTRHISPARIEAVVRRAVELAREKSAPSPDWSYVYESPDEILAQILAEQKEPTE